MIGVTDQPKTSWWNPFSWIGYLFGSGKDKVQSEQNNITPVPETKNERAEEPRGQAGTTSLSEFKRETSENWSPKAPAAFQQSSQPKASWWNPFSWFSAKGTAEIKNTTVEFLKSSKEENTIGVANSASSISLEGTNKTQEKAIDNPNIIQSQEYQNLIEAIQTHNAAWVKLIITKYPQLVHWTNTTRNTPLDLAVLNLLEDGMTTDESQEIFRLLREKEKSIQPEGVEQEQPHDHLVIVVKQGSILAARFLLEEGVPVSSNCLVAAARDDPMLELLLKKTIDQEELNNALRQVAQDGYAPAIQILIDKGANVDSHDSDGNTALHMAIQHDNFDVITLLLSKEANPQIKNNEGQTPIDLISEEIKRCSPPPNPSNERTTSNEHKLVMKPRTKPQTEHIREKYTKWLELQKKCNLLDTQVADDDHPGSNPVAVAKPNELENEKQGSASVTTETKNEEEGQFAREQTSGNPNAVEVFEDHLAAGTVISTELVKVVGDVVNIGGDVVKNLCDSQPGFDDHSSPSPGVGGSGGNSSIGLSGLNHEESQLCLDN